MSTAAQVQGLVFDQRAFQREDERDDERFYRIDRMVPHLDDEALNAVSEIIASLIVEDRPVILDLMASWDSHIDAEVQPRRVVGLGLNRSELEANSVLDELLVHDLNLDPRLPFDDNSFDVVLNTVSVDYLTRPFEVFREVERVLRPGGLFLVLFSNRFFPEKVVRLWRDASQQERELIVEDYFASCGDFTASESYTVCGRPRPETDRYFQTGLPSDPVHAIWAEKHGGAADRMERRPPELKSWYLSNPDELERRKSAVAETMACPYCSERLSKWAVPQTPFTEWDQEFLYLCFNDRCPYLLRGWRAMELQGNKGFSCRLMYNPGNNRCMAMPVPDLRAFRESIIDD